VLGFVLCAGINDSRASTRLSRDLILICSGLTIVDDTERSISASLNLTVSKSNVLNYSLNNITNCIKRLINNGKLSRVAASSFSFPSC